MKDTAKQILFNAGVLAVAGVAFGPVGLFSTPILGLLGVVTLGSVAVAGNTYFVLSSKNENTPALMDKHKITEQLFNSLTTADDYISVMQALADDYKEAADILKNWDAFQKKKATLDTLTVNDGAYDHVTADVENSIISNMKAFIKRVAIIQSESNPAYMVTHKNYLAQIKGNVDNLMAKYTHLLIEVSKLEDGQFDSADKNVESLNQLIESISSYRTHIKG